MAYSNPLSLCYRNPLPYLNLVRELVHGRLALLEVDALHGASLVARNARGLEMLKLP